MLLPNIVLALPTAKFTLLVVDEHNVPIEGADARISFMKASSGGRGSKTYFVSGKTNKDGIFTGQGATEYYATYSANADGYYSTGIKFEGFSGVSGVLGFRKWKPWNPTLKVVMKKIKKPIPMHAYYVNRVDIPKKNEFIGYDLLKHDWVFPNGKGTVADILFKLDVNYTNDRKYNFALTTKFPNYADGIQVFSSKRELGSNLHSAHQAPLAGYQNELIQTMSMAYNGFSSSFKIDDDTNYYFRVRCNDDDIESCFYGKIYGNIIFSKKTLRFEYYLNPSHGDTNVEFNPKKNLFKNLKDKITMP